MMEDRLNSEKILCMTFKFIFAYVKWSLIENLFAKREKKNVNKAFPFDESEIFIKTEMRD